MTYRWMLALEWGARRVRSYRLWYRYAGRFERPGSGV
jgi:hypothetical protein